MAGQGSYLSGCSEELVWVPSAGVGLAGVLHLPASVSRPVLFLHGFTGNKAESGRLYTDMARFLCGSGYAALRFDFRCHGDSPLPFEEFRISFAVEDARNAASFLKSHPSVDGTRFGVVGLSMGGGVAVSLAAGRDDVGALVLLSPALDWQELAQGVRGMFRFEGGYVYWGPNRWREASAMEAMGFSVMDLAGEVRAPTLIVHAVDDFMVPISQAKRFYEKLRVEKKFVEIERGGHVFDDYEVRRRIEGEVLDWVKKHL
ncbi:MAG: alpha/beta fold hydrolase [Thermofilum sp.]|nr:alpha/beta fold hydrolase [Thermofilum sp.]